MAKIELELNIPGDGRVFINFWNNMTGDDVTAELIGDKILVDGTETTISKFIEMVETSFDKV